MTLKCGHTARAVPGCPWCGAVVARPWTWDRLGLAWRQARPETPGLPPSNLTLPPPARVTRIDPTILAPGDAGARFNAGLIRWQGGLLLCYRTSWEGARCHIARLSDDLAPLDTRTLDLTHPLADVGQEDARLFEHAGKLHVSFIGVQRVGRRGIRTHQLYARLRDDFTTEAVYAPQYDWRQGWEKNWAFFSHEGDLHAIYSIYPHVVLRIDGNTATEVARTRTAHPWAGGHARGGAPPVRTGDRYVHVFHGALDPPHPLLTNGRRRYSVGVYTFEASHPFRVAEMTATPVMWADPATCPADVWADVVFPCGLVADGNRWLVSMGVHDRWTDVAEWCVPPPDDQVKSTTSPATNSSE